jgi:peptidoglycan-associated lipoprotein
MTRPSQTALLLALVMLVALFAGCASQSGPMAGDTETAPSPAPAAGAEAEETGETAEGAEADETLEAEGFEEPGLTAEEDDQMEVQTLEQEIQAGREALHTVYFAFDSYKLSDVSLNLLQENARWLKQHPKLDVVVEGHCDERGTFEYNLELGAKRARAVRDHLIELGVSPDRIETISYGEERPAVQGTGERVWSQNRRAEFTLRKP